MDDDSIKDGDVIAWSSLNVDHLIKLMLDTENNPGNWWRLDCLFLYEKRRGGLILVVKHAPSGMYLRYSKGPRQHHSWDLYGDDYMTPELAMVALSQTPPPARVLTR